MSIRSSFDKQLQDLLDDVLTMGSMVDSAITGAVKGLATDDQPAAEKAMADDDKVNRLRFKIEEDCLELIATQQPTGGDLRLIVAAMNIVLDLERIGDHAAGVAGIALQVGGGPLPECCVQLTDMAAIAQEMLRASLSALVSRSSEAALAVTARDSDVDRLYNQISQQIVTAIVKEPQTAGRLAQLLLCTYNLERIADLATNVCERVIFLATGQLTESSDPEELEMLPPLPSPQ